MDALNEQFGTAAEFDDPKGGIFLWVKLPDEVDTLKLYQPALAAGVAINPGPEWTTDKAYGKSRMRLCFANPSHEAIRAGVAALAEVCRREFGVPDRIANVAARARLIATAIAGAVAAERRTSCVLRSWDRAAWAAISAPGWSKGGADVTFIARGAHLAAMRADGLAIESAHEPIRLPKVNATDDPRSIGPVDMVLFGVKLWDTESAARSLLPIMGPQTGIISFQNGVQKDDTLRKHLRRRRRDGRRRLYGHDDRTPRRDRADRHDAAHGVRRI